MITAAFPAWQGTHTLQYTCNTVSERTFTWSMDCLWWSAKLATIVNEPHSARFPCIWLYEKHSVWTQSKQNAEIKSSVFNAARYMNSPDVLCRVKLSMIKKVECVSTVRQAFWTFIKLKCTLIFLINFIYVQINYVQIPIALWSLKVRPLFIWHFSMGMTVWIRSQSTDKVTGNLCVI